jgi:hypothetical protein
MSAKYDDQYNPFDEDFTTTLYDWETEDPKVRDLFYFENNIDLLGILSDIMNESDYNMSCYRFINQILYYNPANLSDKQKEWLFDIIILLKMQHFKNEAYLAWRTIDPDIIKKSYHSFFSRSFGMKSTSNE